MKVSVLSLITLITLVSCGQQNSSPSSSEKSVRQNQDYATDIREVDLLDVVMDAQVDTTSDKIIFRRASYNQANGIRTKCELNVEAGESFQYRLGGNSLQVIRTNGERLQFSRVSGDNGLKGSWFAEQRQGRTHILHRLTFLSDNRLVMRTHCEG